MEVKSIMDGSKRKKGTPSTTLLFLYILKRNDEKDKR